MTVTEVMAPSSELDRTSDIDGNTVVGEPADLATLRHGFNGEIATPADPEYDRYRQHFNRRFDRRPALILRPANTVDVVAAVRYARAADLEIAVSCGGTHPAGFSRTDGGVVIDLSLMRGVRVDPAEQTAWLQGGALGGDMYAETGRHGLAGVMGWMRTTGVGGVNVHGGWGPMSPKLGWGVDTILEMELVTADGEVLRLAPDENAELFWGARGAGSNFGIVTWVKQRLCRVPEKALAGTLMYTAEQGPEVLRLVDQLVMTVSDDMNMWVYSSVIPDEPDYPEALRGRHGYMVVVVHVGDRDAALEELRSLREACPPALDGVVEQSLYDFVCELDSFIVPSRQWYDFVEMESLTDDVIDAVTTSAQRMEELGLTAELTLVATGRGRNPEHPSALATGHRPGAWLMMPDTFWEDVADDEKNIGWADEFMAALSQCQSHTDVGYSNVQARPDVERERRSFGEETWQRLVALKRQYDPHNVFHLNHNIPPG
jgi:FAD/FMN-containing dehydrogenase